jgi:phosphoribosylanthranilate isomerase
VFVKICGVTNESDALMATAMGADAVGFIFAPSSRQVQPTVVRDIVRRLPPEVLTVGVFRNETPERVVEIVNAAGLRGAQLHGFESAAEAAFVRDRVPFVLKAFAVGHPLLERIDDYEVDAVLLDGPEPGSGKLADWDLARHLAGRYRLLLAGGLRPDNVAMAVAEVAPWGVDVASGVESSPGYKDVRLTRRFVLAARAAGAALAEGDGTWAEAGDDGAGIDDPGWGSGAPIAGVEGVAVDEPFDFDPAPWEPAEPPADEARQGTLYDWEGEGPR